MKQPLHILTFSNSAGIPSALAEAMLKFNASPVQPSEVEGVEVALVVVDRPAANAVKICANLRNLHLSKVPILVLIDPGEGDHQDQFSALKADVMFKPAKPKALDAYFTRAFSIAAAPCPVPQGQKESEQKQATARAVPPIPSPPKESGPKPLVAKPSPLAPTADSKEKGHKPPEVRPAQPLPSHALPDIRVESKRLLHAIEGPVPASSGTVVCLRCHAWDCRREDVFCSRCGCALVDVEPVTSLVSFEPLGSRRIDHLVELKNDGVNPAFMQFNVLASDALVNRFSVTPRTAILDGRSSGEIILTLDARALDLRSGYCGEMEIISNSACNGRQKIDLIVERPAKARVVALKTYQFIIGAENEWEFHVSNDGGGTLKVSGLKLDEMALARPSATVKGSSQIKVIVTVPPLDLSAGNHRKKLRWEFENCDPITVDLAIEARKPGRLTVLPLELDFGVVSTRRTRRLALKLSNSGGEPLAVCSLKSSVEWVKPISPTPLTLAPGASLSVEVEATGAAGPAGDQPGELVIESNSYPNSLLTVPLVARFVEPEPYEEYIGIDFGTTASCVAIIDHGRPVVIELDHESDDPCIMPSVLYFNDDGTVAAGREAQRKAAIQPAKAVASIKRALGVRHKREFGGREYTPAELASKVVEQLAARAEDGLFTRGQYKTPRKAIVTVPVEFSDNQRRELIHAYSLAGLDMEDTSHDAVVRDEAHAAALYYLTRRVEQSKEEESERVMIFDFGGGTLDCVLIDIEAQDGGIRFNTLALGGDPRLGGDDLDWAIVGLLSGRVKERYPDFDDECLAEHHRFTNKYRAPDLLESAYRSRAEFKRQAEQAKINMCAAHKVEVTIGYLLSKKPSTGHFLMDDGTQAKLKTTITREDFEQAIEPLIQRSVEVVKSVCHRAGVEAESVNTILHVGRTSLLPTVRERVKACLRNAEDRSSLIEPKKCVAMGAAYWGYLKDRPGVKIEFTGAVNRLPHDIGFLDVTGVRNVFKTVFPAGVSYPCEQVLSFPKNREWIDIRLAENRGINDAANGAWEAIEKVRIDARRIAAGKIDIRFAINENRMLEITVNGEHQKIVDLSEERNTAGGRF